MKPRHQIERLRRYVKDSRDVDQAIERTLGGCLDIVEGMLEGIGDGAAADELEMEAALAEIQAMLRELRKAIPELVKTAIERP